MGKTSIVHIYFTQDKQDSGVFHCTLCDYKVTLRADPSATTSKKRHLEKMHKSNIPSLTVQETQPKLNFLVKKEMDPQEKATLDKLVRNMVIMDMMPFRIVEKPGFTALLQRANPSYTLPCTKTITEMVMKAHTDIMKAVKSEVSVHCVSMCISFDMWTSLAKKGYIGITGHYLTEAMKMRCHALQVKHMPGSHTGTEISKVVQDTLEQYGKPLLSQTIDNGANGVDGAKQTKTVFGGAIIRCFAHTLQLDITPILKQHVPTLHEKIGNIFNKFSHSSLLQDMLLEKQALLDPSCTPLKLIRPNDTRWSSFLEACKRLVDVQQSISLILPIIDSKRTKKEKAGTAKKKKEAVELTGTEWDIIKMLVELLVPVALSTTILGGQEYATASVAFPHLRTMSKHYAAFRMKYALTAHKEVLSICDALRKTLIDRFALKTNKEVLLASVLNPHFKDLRFLETTSGVDTWKKGALDELDVQYASQLESMQVKGFAFTSTEEKPAEIEPKAKRPSALIEEAYMKSLHTPAPVATAPHFDEKKLYFSLPPPGKDADILRWWYDHRLILPVLFQLARRYLAIPATSVPVESLWSDAGNICSKKRAALDTEKLAKLVMAYKNREFLD